MHMHAHTRTRTHAHTCAHTFIFQTHTVAHAPHVSIGYAPVRPTDTTLPTMGMGFALEAAFCHMSHINLMFMPSVCERVCVCGGGECEYVVVGEGGGVHVCRALPRLLVCAKF